MRKLLLLPPLLLLSFVAPAQSAPVAMTVADTAVTVLPARPAGSNVAWTNGMTLVQGQVVAHEGGLFFAESAGTSTNTPVIGSTVGRLRSIQRGQRVMAVVQNLGSVDVYISFDGPAVAARGLKIGPNAVVTIEDISAAVSAVTTSGSTSLGIQEITK